MLVVLVVVLLVSPALAQESAPPRVGVTAGQFRMTLQQAIEMGLANNLNLQIEKSNVADATQALQGSRGAYDPRFRWRPALLSENVPAPSVLQGVNGKLGQHLHSENFYFDQKLPWNGSSFGLSFENARVSSSNPFLALNPFFTSSVGFTVKQALWRGRIADAAETTITIRRRHLERSDAELQSEILDVMARVEQAYWDLVTARQNAAVKEESVTLARTQVAKTKRMIEQGELASVEQSAAEAEFSRRLDAWYSSVGAITTAENALKALIADGARSQLWSQEVIPAEDLALTPPALDDLRPFLEEALKSRPELKQAAAELEVNNVEKLQRSDAVKPKVDLLAEYHSVGFSGSPNAVVDPISAANMPIYQRVNALSTSAGLPPVSPLPFGTLPPDLSGGYGTALSNITSGRYQAVQVGIEFEWTPRNREAVADLTRAEIAGRRLKLKQTQVEQIIEAQVRDGLQAVETSRLRIAAAESSAAAAKTKLESETRLFQTGESTNFMVLTRQNEYSDAELRLLVARMDLNRAMAQLERAVGNGMEKHHISIQ